MVLGMKGWEVLGADDKVVDAAGTTPASTLEVDKPV